MLRVPGSGSIFTPRPDPESSARSYTLSLVQGQPWRALRSYSTPEEAEGLLPGKRLYLPSFFFDVVDGFRSSKSIKLPTEQPTLVRSDVDTS